MARSTEFILIIVFKRATGEKSGAYTKLRRYVGLEGVRFGVVFSIYRANLHARTHIFTAINVANFSCTLHLSSSWRNLMAGAGLKQAHKGTL